MKVAIFGAGTMGRGIAQVFAANGHTALMYASSIASAQRHKEQLDALCKAGRQRQNVSGTKDALMANVLVEEESAPLMLIWSSSASPRRWSQEGAVPSSGRAVQARDRLCFQHLLFVHH